MIYIDLLNDKKNIRLKPSKSSDTFFVNFFKKIDENTLANLYLKIDDEKYNLDFNYDFLSVYDFLPDVLQYLNSGKQEEIFTLLLYERGNDRLEFLNITNEVTKVSLNFNSTNKVEVFNIIFLNKVFYNLIKNIEMIQSSFDIDVINKQYLLKWEKSVTNNILL